jgi:glycerol-3-phosphate dehydrogenase
VTTRNTQTGETREFKAKVLVNAAGPWVTEVVRNVAGANSSRNVRLVKGSHIVVPKFWEGANAYLIQNDDKRVIFINPYEGDKALIGTTDIPHEGAAEDVTIDEDEIAYLLKAVNRYFKEKLRREDVLESFSGVRPLFDDGQGNPSAVTRDYVFDLDTKGAPLLNVFGGKITTFRELAERGMHELGEIFPKMGRDWTHKAPLPGGDMKKADYEAFRETLKAQYPWMPVRLRQHYGRLYGTRVTHVVGDAASLDGLGRHFGGDLYAAEAHYLMEKEWAQTAEDILWRRTKHRLHLSEAEQAAFAEWFDAQAKRAA